MKNKIATKLTGPFAAALTMVVAPCWADEPNASRTLQAITTVIAGGGDAVVLRNEHGVFIKLARTSQGLRFDLAGSGVSVKLES
jgi:hypothetical protein